MMIVRLLVLPVLSVCGIGLAAYSVHRGNAPVPPAPGVGVPASSPYAARVSATGVIEAGSRNVALGVARPGVVIALPHDIGSQVAAGELLLQIDDREARARLAAAAASLRAAEQEQARLQAMPRAEEVAPRRAAVAQRRAELDDARALLAIATGIADPRAISREETTRRSARVAIAEAAVAEAEAQLQLSAAPAWAPDLAVAAARVEVARAGVASAQSELDQMALRAPFAGKVLAVNVRVGEYAAAGAASAAIVFGDVALLHVRADVDEMDVWRLRPDAPAKAFLRGNAQASAPLRFVAIEPLMVPKRSLSGSSREQVDTRVLQVLYALDPAALPVQIGQLVDVFVDAADAASPATGAGK